MADGWLCLKKKRARQNRPNYNLITVWLDAMTADIALKKIVVVKPNLYTTLSQSGWLSLQLAQYVKNNISRQPWPYYHLITV